MLRVEFHCHTAVSEDCLVPPQKLVDHARKKGIDRVVVTDHNSIRGALQARAIDPELIIIGEEILTQKGEILASFVKEEIPPFLSPLETVQRLKDQDAFISVSHPFDLQRKGWREEDLVEILPFVDAIEIFNSRSLTVGINQRAVDFARAYGLAGTVGSDAHILNEVGASILILPDFNSAEELRAVIRSGRQETKLSPAWVHFGSTFARILKAVREATKT